MKKMLFLITLVLLTTINIQAQKPTESIFKNGYIRVDQRLLKVNGQMSDTLDCFGKTKEWAKKNYQGVIYNPNKSSIHVETDEYLLAINFNKIVGCVYYEFKDKGKYGEQPFTGRKQRVISNLAQALNQ